MVIDTHVHLNFKAFDTDLDYVIKRAEKRGVTKFIIPGTKLDSSKKAINIARQYDSCYAAVGIHPHHLNEVTHTGIETIKKQLSEFIKEKKVVAIGETGLDYHQYHGYPPLSAVEKKNQKELLLFQLTLATETKLPVIIHCRNAHDDLLDMLKSFLISNNLTGVFHCFDGKKNHLFKVLDLGFFVGFDGNITYPENKKLIELLKLTPINRLLLETDSPFLTPLKFRGIRNEPANLNYIVSFMANVFNKKINYVAKNAFNNTLMLFRILC